MGFGRLQRQVHFTKLVNELCMFSFLCAQLKKKYLCEVDVLILILAQPARFKEIQQPRKRAILARPYLDQHQLSRSQGITSLQSG